MVNYKFLKLSYFLKERGFIKECFLLEKIAKDYFFEILKAEVRNILFDEKLPNGISNVRTVTFKEMEKLLFDVGCDFVSAGKHKKFISKELIYLKNNINLIPEEYRTKFIATVNSFDPKSEFFMIQLGPSSSIPVLNHIRQFWKFARLALMSKIILYDIIPDKKNNSSKKDKSQNNLEIKKESLISLLKEKEDFLDKNLLSMENEEIEKIDSEIQKLKTELNSLLWINLN